MIDTIIYETNHGKHKKIFLLAQKYLRSVGKNGIIKKGEMLVTGSACYDKKGGQQYETDDGIDTRTDLQTF